MGLNGGGRAQLYQGGEKGSWSGCWRDVVRYTLGDRGFE